MISTEKGHLAVLEKVTEAAVTESIDSKSVNCTDILNLSGDIKITSDSPPDGNFNSESTVESCNVSVQVAEKEKNWAELPSPAVKTVYSFLSRSDQSRMSLVCSRWTNDFKPILWNTMKFYLPDNDNSSEIYQEVRFARMYGSMFQNVEIICKTVQIHLIDIIWKQLKLFLQAMESSSELISIKFIDMGNYFNYLDDILHEDLFKTITSFLKSQKNFQTVVFQNSHFNKEDGMELLKTLLHSSSNTIRNLTLRGFVKEIPSTVFSKQYESNLWDVCDKIMNVQHLEVDYSQIFEDLINCLYDKLSSSVNQFDATKSSKLTINMFYEEKGQLENEGIPFETWDLLTKLFPYLIVKMDVTVQGHLNKDIWKLLVRGIPLRRLDFHFENLTTHSMLAVRALLMHLETCKYENLEILNVSF